MATHFHFATELFAAQAYQSKLARLPFEAILNGTGICQALILRSSFNLIKTDKNG